MTQYLNILTKKQFKMLFYITSIFVLYQAVKLSQGAALFDFKHGDKLLHAMAFFVLAFLLNRSSSSIKKHIRNGIALLGFGIFIELVQGLTNHRDTSLGDILADILGILFFQFTYTVLKFWQKKVHQRRERKNLDKIP